MCPNECPGLFTNHSEEFEKLYLKYEEEGKGRKNSQGQGTLGKNIGVPNRNGHPIYAL